MGHNRGISTRHLFLIAYIIKALDSQRVAQHEPVTHCYYYMIWSTIFYLPSTTMRTRIVM